MLRAILDVRKYQFFSGTKKVINYVWAEWKSSLKVYQSFDSPCMFIYSVQKSAKEDVVKI